MQNIRHEDGGMELKALLGQSEGSDHSKNGASGSTSGTFLGLFNFPTPSQLSHHLWPCPGRQGSFDNSPYLKNEKAEGQSL